MTTPRIVADYACNTGENPLWHVAEQRLYWTDIPAGRLFRYDPATDKHEIVYEGRPVGGFTIQADGALLLFMDRGTVAVWRDGQIERTIIDELPGELDSRFNDVIADPEGRVYCGTMSVKDADGKIVRYGRLYRLDLDGSIHVLVEGLGTSNGMGFTPDGRHMYHTDTPTHCIYRYDYDRATGAISNRQIFIQVPQDPPEGRPDGMTVDRRGHIWGARWDGSRVVHYDENGHELEHIPLPVENVSCVTFGGPDFSQMYITTAGGHERPQNGIHAGALFRIDNLATGVPEFPSRIQLT